MKGIREYLFRGKRKDNGEWVDGDLIYEPWGSCIQVIKNDNINTFKRTKYSVHKETVGQYTGMKDCKRTEEYPEGQMIFEGDIIKIPNDYDEFGHNAGEIYEIYFCCGGFRLKPKYSQARGYWLENDRTVEVIGNIHDNPELLKEGEEK